MHVLYTYVLYKILFRIVLICVIRYGLPQGIPRREIMLAQSKLQPSTMPTFKECRSIKNLAAQNGPWRLRSHQRLLHARTSMVRPHLNPTCKCSYRSCKHFESRCEMQKQCVPSITLFQNNRVSSGAHDILPAVPSDHISKIIKNPRNSNANRIHSYMLYIYMCYTILT